MKEQKFYWLLLWGILLTEGYLIYFLSDMMYVAPTQTVTVLEKDINDDVDESVDEDLYYQTLWQEKEENAKSDK